MNSHDRTQPMTATHTPTPWGLDGSYVVAKYGPTIADCGKSPSLDRGTQRANAAFIVEAVNNYASLKARIEELEAALRFIADGYENHNINHVDYRVRVYQVATEVLGAKND